MAIEARQDTGNFWDWFNIPGLDGKAMGGAIGSKASKTASTMGGLGATYGGALGLLYWLLSDLFPKGGASKPIPNVSTDKILPKDFDKYGSTAWPEAEQMLREVLSGKGNVGTLLDSYSKWLRNTLAWPNEGKMVETLPLGQTGRLDVPAPATPTTNPRFNEDMTWPNEGKMVETLPLGQTGRLDVPAPATPTTNPRFNEDMTWPNEGKMVETLPEGIAGAISTPATPPNKINDIANTWPFEELMDRLIIPPLTGNSQLDITKPITPGTTATTNHGTATWPDEGKMVETLPLGDTGKLDVPAPVLPGTTTTNHGTAAWPNEGKLVETLPLGDTGKLDVTKPIIDVRPNVDVNNGTDVGTDVGTNEWVSGAANATAAWPNEGMMVESLPPYHNDREGRIPMITDKTDENQETTINPVSFDSFYDLIRAEQKERWAREDAIRKHIEEREDNAWQRAVDDMFKAGVNPNLVNAGPAESGGGINTATGMNYSMWEAGLQKEIALLQQSLEQNFKGDENEKDRFTQILGNVLSMFSVIAMFKGKI